MSSKSKKIILVIVFVALAAVAGFAGYRVAYVHSLKYCQAYVPGKGNIKGNVDVKYFLSKGKAFAIGANKNGYAVFKNPDAAWDAMISGYQDGIKLIQSENHLKDISKKNFRPYLILDVSGGTAKARKDAAFVSSFLDIYQNSQP